MCVDLAVTGCRSTGPGIEALIEEAAGPVRSPSPDEVAAHAHRDKAVLDLVPGREATDLPQSRSGQGAAHGVGVEVPNTRKWVLGGPACGAPGRRRPPRLARKRADRHHLWAPLVGRGVGADDRLRGSWTACDGAGGRMTADNGLHNLPAALRPGVAAHLGRVLVRADLGQIEPRVLAVVSGDRTFAEATRADDLYAPVAARLGVERPIAKRWPCWPRCTASDPERR